MTWTVNYAEHAKWDLRGIYEFISDMLLEPIAAKTQTDRIMNAADSLAHFPLRHRLYDGEPWRSRGLRIMPVDNYVLLYLLNEPLQTVTITRIMYGGCDIDRQLNHTK